MNTCENRKLIKMSYFKTLTKEEKNNYILDDYEIVNTIKEIKEPTIEYYDHDKIDDDLIFLKNFDDFSKVVHQDKEVLKQILYNAFETRFPLAKDKAIKKKGVKGERVKATDQEDGCNYSMKNGDRCGAKCGGGVCSRHRGLYADRTERGIHPISEGQGLTYDAKRTKLIKRTDKYFMYPLYFKNNFIDETGIKSNALELFIEKHENQDEELIEDMKKCVLPYNLLCLNGFKDGIRDNEGIKGILDYSQPFVGFEKPKEEPKEEPQEEPQEIIKPIKKKGRKKKDDK